MPLQSHSVSKISIYFLNYIYFCTRFILFGVPSDRIKSQKTAVLAERTVREFPSTEHYQVCWPPRLIHSLYSQRYWGKLCWPTLYAGIVLYIRADVGITVFIVYEQHQKFAAIYGGDSTVLLPCFAFISPASRAAKLSPEPCFRRKIHTGWTFNQTVISSGPSMAVKYGGGSVQTKTDEP